MDVWTVQDAPDYKQGKLYWHSLWGDGCAVFSTLAKAKAFAESEARQALTWHEYNQGDGMVAEYQKKIFSKVYWSAIRIFRDEVDLHEV